ncbi:hypothetical protein B0T25DRAFT_608050 [Lasiosphaeria hispida]|uniref:Uncharacterized protein n=1 Tax=Lasiosphaeria hispida TaxID=260671 RepID=A0AAJ0HJE6_9PEZI|nr:hypothetical protein B0T25DRAFT_608050 [Lasiosphaeria hispida]
MADIPLATLPRGRAYLVARNHFWAAFPRGAYARLPTPGTDLECAFHALRISMAHQAAPRCLAIPTLAELRGVVDQLGAVFGEWGAGKGVGCQLGYASDEGRPVLINTATVTAGDEDPGVVRVWVYNDGVSLRGGMGHYEGIRAVEGDGEE